MDAAQNRIICPSCGKHYVWKEQLAGKRVKCACGEAFSAPVEPPGGVAESEDLYGLSDEPAPAFAHRVDPELQAAPMPVMHASVSPPPLVQQAHAPAPPKVLTYESKRVFEEKRKAMFEHWRLADLWLPLTLVVLGFGCRQIAPFMQTAIGGPRLALTIALVTVGLAFNIILMVAALKIAAKMTDAEFGSPAQATIKLGFMFVVSAAAGAFCASLGKFDGFSITFGAHVAIVFYWILFPLLFKTGLQETMWTVSIIIILQAIVNIGVWKV